MNKLKMLGVTALAATSIGVGVLAAPEPASALPPKCELLAQKARIARAAGNVFWGLGQKQLASYYYGQAAAYREQAIDCNYADD